MRRSRTYEGARSSKRKISSEFSKKEQTTASLYNLKKLAQLFHVAIRFHPRHPKLTTLIGCFNALNKYSDF